MGIMWIHKSKIAQAYKFYKKIDIFGYPIIYCDREVNDEDDDGAGEDEKDDLTIKFIQQIPYQNRQLPNRLSCHNFHYHLYRRH